MLFRGGEQKPEFLEGGNCVALGLLDEIGDDHGLRPGRDHEVDGGSRSYFNSLQYFDSRISLSAPRRL